MEQDVAYVDDHVSVEVFPEVMLVGLAERVAVGAGGTYSYNWQVVYCEAPYSWWGFTGSVFSHASVPVVFGWLV
jgi:hypothetical protein